jgi:hypothetical protein
MKKALKIFGITLGSILGLILLVIGAAIWVVFTPERLTPIVRGVASEYVTCEHKIGKVELTFFSTFPRFGLRIDSVAVIHPMEGAPSDTLVHIPHAVLSVDVLALLNEGTLSIPTLRMPDLQANIYVAADGSANYDILAFPADTTAEDTTATALPFQTIQIEEIQLSAQQLRYISEPDTMDIRLRNTRIHTAQPILADLQKMHIALQDAQIATNGLALTLNGWAQMGDTIQTDMRLTLRDWAIDSVLALLPITLDNDITELVQGGYASLDATAKINMADSAASEVLVHQLAAHLQHTNLQAHGVVKDPLGKL